MKKIIKQNLRFYSKFALLIGALIAFICSFGVSSYAWHEDTNGNLASDNLIDNSTSVFEMGAVSYNIGRTYEQNKVSINTRIRTINLIDVDSTKTYSLSVPSPYLVIAQGYENGLNVSATGTQFNQALSSLTFTGVSQVSIIVRKIDNSSFSNVTAITSIDLMFNEGNPKSYEEYGMTYYNYDVVEKASNMSYGCFKYASSIKIYYDNGTITNLYKEFSNITDFTLEKYVRFTNNTLYIDDYKLIFTLLNGNSSWKYAVDVTFPMGKVKVGDFQEWYIYADSATNIDSFTSGVSYSTSVGGNPLVVDLTSQGFSSNDYIYKVIYTRRNPNIALAYGAIGTPNVDSTYYNNGYNSGYDVGYSDGYDSGFSDSKSEHYDMGYNDGYRDGEESDFTTNGFKTLIGSIFNYPINMIRSIFNFEFMGINIFSIIVFVMSIGIVIFVIRRFKK